MFQAPQLIDTPLPHTKEGKSSYCKKKPPEVKEGKKEGRGAEEGEINQGGNFCGWRRGRGVRGYVVCRWEGGLG